eukprot:CAMPEP_0203807848 /NCGR_PEP_ID=MMETSP0115-20131106/1287_1 /ASSEMBLY_ACC=CAM_ASM_000227 /TAXON_ID=33651 /ORGANISM="Bicosoecid sp, Strain ms1" /LENGTH=143 /DNA_ID=CAMNT_0050716533 /DNA_START=16 /DNA_END=444 /DNA_ORIENTATION=-
MNAVGDDDRVDSSGDVGGASADCGASLYQRSGEACAATGRMHAVWTRPAPAGAPRGIDDDDGTGGRSGGGARSDDDDDDDDGEVGGMTAAELAAVVDAASGAMAPSLTAADYERIVAEELAAMQRGGEGEGEGVGVRRRQAAA